MAESGPNLALQRCDAVETPHILSLRHADDPMRPVAHLESFGDGYRKAGGELTLGYFEGEKCHAVRTAPESTGAHNTVREIITFVAPAPTT